jgi:ABC-type branched-subunit amino acid transport system substrate-binding protein
MILPFDTKGTEKGAKEAIKKAVESKVDLVLGPLFSDLAKVVAPIADDNDINVISFSNNQELTDEGIFLLGFMPEQQVKRVVLYANENGIEEFSSIAPKNKFGEITVDELKRTLRRKFKRTKYTEYYQSIDRSLSNIIGKFAKPLPEEEEEEITENIPIDENEPAFLAKEGEANIKASDFKYEFDLNKEEEIVKTEGILVPEGGRKAENIAARLFRYGLDSKHIRLLGTGQWDDPMLLKEKKLIGSWFATSSPKLKNIFENHFKKNFGYKPVRIASLAYDGVALASYLASQNDFSKSAITNRRGFSGINGVFRISSDGASERALAVIEITKDGFEVIDPAPQDFRLFR